MKSEIMMTAGMVEMAMAMAESAMAPGGVGVKQACRSQAHEGGSLNGATRGRHTGSEVRAKKAGGSIIDPGLQIHSIKARHARVGGQATCALIS